MSSTTVSLSSALLQECEAIVTQSGSTITTLVDAAKNGQWTSADTQQLVKLVQPLLQYLGDFKSVGIVAVIGGSLIVSVEEIPGAVLDTTNLNADPWLYSFTGASIGFAEGGEGAAGILVAQGEPSSLKGFQLFADADVTVGAGVGVQCTAGGEQWFVFVSAGEEVNVSVGAGHVSVKQL